MKTKNNLLRNVAAVSADFFRHAFFPQFWDEYSDQIGGGHVGMAEFVAKLGVAYTEQEKTRKDSTGEVITGIIDFTLQFFEEVNGNALSDVADPHLLKGIAERAYQGRARKTQGRTITIRGFRKAPAKRDTGRRSTRGKMGIGYVEAINRPD